MDRRDFIKAGSAWLAFGLATLLPNLQVSAGGRTDTAHPRFRGSPDGRIYELDADGVWRSRANLGQHCAIPEVIERDGRIHARVVVQGHPFILQSTDGRQWRSVIA